MPVDAELLTYFDRMSREEYEVIEHLEQHGKLQALTAAELLEELIKARFALAENLLTYVRALRPTGEIEQRLCIAHAYYAMHHAARALLLSEHREEITSHHAVAARIQEMDASRAQQLRRWKAHRERSHYNPSLPIRPDHSYLAQQCAAAAEQFVRWVRQELQRKGVTL